MKRGNLQDTSPNALRNGLILLVFVGVITALLAATFEVTHSVIRQNKQQAKLALISQVLLPSSFDNDLLSTGLTLPADEMLGTRSPSRAWIARKHGRPTGLVLEAIAPDGYGGDIALLIGINARGEITGVRVIRHHETPGLGDYIEIAKNHWILQFNGKSLTHPAETAWRVRQDGGSFDARAGATITPRAVVKALKLALQYFLQHRLELLAMAAPT
jgi:electron transport complex protein RnfG